ncbi:MAG: conjugal transfer protein TraF [Planctomycetes bacterium]|nr:conjugal transfer protein TraF [Planctomycetota bacterium]
MFAPLASAEEWITYGARQRALGNNGVTISRGADAIYWNPANLPRFNEKPEDVDEEDWNPNRVEDTSWHLQVGVGAEASVQGRVLSELDEVADKINQTSSSFDNIEKLLGDPANSGLTPTEATQTFSTLLGAVDEIMDLDKRGQGVYATLSGGVDLRILDFGIGVHQFAWAAADPVIDISAGGSASALVAGGIENLFENSQGGGGGIPVGSAPTSQVYQNFSSRIETLLNNVGAATSSGGVTNKQRADAIAAAAETAGVDVNDPQFNQAIDSMVTATGSNSNPGAPAGNNEDVFFNNQSGIDLRILSVREVAVAYGTYLNFSEGWFGLGIGGALKFMEGSTYSRRFAVADLENQDGEEILKEAKDKLTSSDETAFDFGLDLGAVINLGDTLRFGIVGKNLNTPSFDFERTQTTKGSKKVDNVRVRTVELAPQIRVGAELHFFRDWFVFTAETDLYPASSDLLPGYDTQMAGAGFEITPIATGWFGLSLRAGVFDNLADKNDDMGISAGIGLQLFFLQLEVGASYTPSDVQIQSDDPNRPDDSKDIPQRLGVSVTLSLNQSF